jgi:hypothetical protein
MSDMPAILLVKQKLDEMIVRVDTLSQLYEGALARITALEGDSAKPRKPVVDENGCIPRGSYQGRRHEDIVEKDPWHVDWLANKGLAAGLGYTDAQVEEAQQLAAKRPNPRGRR